MNFNTITRVKVRYKEILYRVMFSVCRGLYHMYILIIMYTFYTIQRLYTTLSLKCLYKLICLMC